VEQYALKIDIEAAMNDRSPGINQRSFHSAGLCRKTVKKKEK